MGGASVIDRIRGVAFRAGANRPIRMDDAGRVLWVEQGHLDLFVVETGGEGEPGRRRFVTRVPAGAMCFGAPRLADPEGAAGRSGFLAVPSVDAAGVEGERSRLVSREHFDLDTTRWIDEWVFRLSEFLVREEGQPPRDARLLEADPDVPYPAGCAVSAHHRDVVWVSADRPMRFLGLGGLAAGGDRRLIPLTERTWCEVDEDTGISAFHTPGVVAAGRLWPALDRFGALVLQYAAIARARRADTARERQRRVRTARRATGEKMFRSLGAALGAGRGARDAAAPEARTPLQKALSIVTGAAVLDVPRGAEEDTDPKRAVEALARRSGIRTRRIRLVPGWWRRDGPSFFGTRGEEERPLALLSNGRGAYRAVDAESGAAGVVGDAEAAEIAPLGVTFHAPLPESVDSGPGALRHCLRGRGRDTGVLVTMAVLGALASLLTPILTGVLLAGIIPRVDVPMWVACLAALLLAALGAATFDVVRALALLRIEGRVDERLQAVVWSRLLSLGAPFFRRYTAGDLAERANGVSVIRQMLTGATANALVGGVFSLFSYALLFFYSWRLALCAGGLALVLIGATWCFARGAMRHHRAALAARGGNDGFVFQMITGFSKLRMANAEGDALAHWAGRYAEQKRETLAARRWHSAQHAFNGMFTPLCMLALFAFIWYLLIGAGKQPAFDLADFLSFNAAFGQFAAAMIGMSAAGTAVAAVVPLFERVRPILEARPETARGSVDPGDPSGDVEFSNVSFRYLPELPSALTRVSFHVRPGDFVAFVGPSGSGKSTIFRLLLGFERPDAGAILLDGHDLFVLDLPAVRRRMGVVLQNGQLGAESLFRNIAGSSLLTMDDAWKVARAVGLEADIRAMPMGMHTVLSEGGGGLSGGQRQRLLIARALARKPRVLLFDEATSALDNRTQEIVKESLRKLSVTRVVIAHRLSTIRDADRIHVLDAGEIVETGRYDDLMARNGAFAALARRQVV